jgi:hypothetical protein
VRQSSRKKKFFSPVFPSDPVGAEFCQWFWQLNRGWDWIVGNCPTPQEKTHWTTEDFPLQPDELWRRHTDPNEAVGVSFKKLTRYCLLDVDRGSAYHPDNDSTKYAALLAALRIIGLISPVLVRSSWSEGLHIYYPLPKAVSSFGLACAIKWTLCNAGILLTSGQVEVFPNTKGYGKDGNFVQYKSHRLPLQPESGSALMNATLEPYSDSIEDLLDEFKQASIQQDLKLLEPAMASSWERQKLSRGYGSGDKAEKWKHHLENRLYTGWTAFSQTNGLIKDIATYGRVFLRLEGKGLIDYTVQTATSAPGYEQFCRHQHEIRLRAAEWSSCVEAYYWPLGTDPTRSGTYAEHFHREPALNCPQALNNIVSFNAARSAQAEDRIRQALGYLESSGNLPDTATARSYAIIGAAKLLTGTGISQTTLHKLKYLPLWHPDHYQPQAKKCVIDLPEQATADLSRQKYPTLPDPWLELELPEPALLQAFPQNYTSFSYMKGLVLPEASNEPQAQLDALDSSNFLKSSDTEIHKETKCQEKSGAVDFEHKQPLSLVSATATKVETTDFIQIAKLRVQAICYAQKTVRREALSLGRMIRGSERALKEQIARMQFYWQSDEPSLMSEAMEWTSANPGELHKVLSPADSSSGNLAVELPDVATTLNSTESASHQSPTADSSDNDSSSALAAEDELQTKPSPTTPPSVQLKQQLFNRRLQPVEILTSAGKWLTGYFVHSCIAVANLIGTERQYTLFDADGETYNFLGQIRSPRKIAEATSDAR